MSNVALWLLLCGCCCLQAPHVHFLLLEAADILGLHPLPQMHVVQAAAPFVHMLRVPTAKLPAASDSSSSSSAAQRQQQGEVVYSRQRQVLLVASSAALQLLQPGELQAAMAGALTPAALAEGGEICRVRCVWYIQQCLLLQLLLSQKMSPCCYVDAL
jgi:hypothetical protein